MTDRPCHALTIDVEDWNNGAVLLLTGRVEAPTNAVVGETERMLQIVEARGLRATWFVLGEIAEHFPALVRRIADAGHEVGVHGYHHELVYTLSPGLFRERAQRAKEVVEQAAGVPVHGYRAAAASITRSTWWALEILAEVGFTYDSSVFPFRGTRYGVPDAPLEPHWICHNGRRVIYEVPLTVVELGGLHLPACGGGYLRHFPYVYTAAAMRHVERTGRRAVVYLHPYELGLATQPRVKPGWLGWRDTLRLRTLWWSQNRNRSQTEAKLQRLLERFQFGPVSEVFDVDAVYSRSLES